MMEKKLMIMLWAVVALTFGSCSKNTNEPDKPKNPIENLQLPLSSADNPIKSGETVTISGKGFIASSEIWLRTAAKSSDVKAEISSVTSTSISFVAPAISGENNVVLKQNGQEFTLGTMYFDNSSESKIYLPKKIYNTEDGESMLFEYDSLNRITKITYPEKEVIMQIHYISDSKFIAEYTEPDNATPYLIDTFTVNNNTVTVKELKDYYYRFEYTYTLENNKPVKFVSTNDTIVYSYDTNGNLKTEKSSSLQSSYNYDNKNGFFSNINLPVWLIWEFERDLLYYPYFTVNNLVSAIDREWNISYEYTYNDEDYPITVLITENWRGEIKQSKIAIEYM